MIAVVLLTIKGTAKGNSIEARPYFIESNHQFFAEFCFSLDLTGKSSSDSPTS